MELLNLPELIREVRNSIDFIIDLPKKLSSILGDCQIASCDRRERIRRQKENAEIREIGKCLQQAYHFKGDFIAWAKSVSDRTNDEDVQFVKEIFDEVANCLDQVRKTIHTAIKPYSNRPCRFQN